MDSPLADTALVWSADRIRCRLCRETGGMQIVTGVGDEAMAAMQAYRYVKNSKDVKSS